jgi:hypothetical protein
MVQNPALYLVLENPALPAEFIKKKGIPGTRRVAGISATG